MRLIWEPKCSSGHRGLWGGGGGRVGGLMAEPGLEVAEREGDLIGAVRAEDGQRALFDEEERAVRRLEAVVIRRHSGQFVSGVNAHTGEFEVANESTTG